MDLGPADVSTDFVVDGPRTVVRDGREVTQLQLEQKLSVDVSAGFTFEATEDDVRLVAVQLTAVASFGEVTSTALQAIRIMDARRCAVAAFAEAVGEVLAIDAYRARSGPGLVNEFVLLAHAEMLEAAWKLNPRMSYKEMGLLNVVEAGRRTRQARNQGILTPAPSRMLTEYGKELQRRRDGA